MSERFIRLISGTGAGHGMAWHGIEPFLCIIERGLS